MLETTQKVRRRKLKGLKTESRTDKQSFGTYYYPKTNLYTRKEFELLDTIYSDEPQTQDSKETILVDNFWPQNKEEYLTDTGKKTNFFNNLTWLTAGVIISSILWLIFFQFKITEIKTKHDTQIVFHDTASLVTDKTVDQEVSKKLGTEQIAMQESETIANVPKTIQPTIQKVEVKKPVGFQFPNWFAKKPVNVTPQPVAVAPQMIAPAPPSSQKFHTVSNGDSLWTIANKYYSDPSPGNIEKIMKANNMRRVGLLSVGQKVAIP